MRTSIPNRPGFALIVAMTALLLSAISAIASPVQGLAAGGAETITVTTLDDVSDFTGPQQVGNLPGPDGLVSFREAVTAANNTPGPQTIAFAIPSATFWLFPGVGMLRLEQGPFFLTDSGTTIDFSTQTAKIGDTNPNGPEIGIYGLEPNGAGIAAVFVNGNNCVIKGLGSVYQRGYAIQITGNDNRVIGCLIEGPVHAAVLISGSSALHPSSGNVVGGTGAGEGNSLAGLTIDGPADGNIVIGNPLLVGVAVHGASPGVIASANRIGGPAAAEGNVIAGAGSYGEEGFPSGDQVSIIDADNTLIEGNYIGTTADGMHAYPQIGPVGVEVRDSRGTTVRGNVIAGLSVAGYGHAAGQIFGQAVYINAVNANTDGTVIQGNTIGVAANGITPIPTHSGIVVSPASGLRHASGTLISSNHIASVETTGILVTTSADGVTITRNSIHDSGSLGIDLTGSGNRSQSYPQLVSAATTGSTVVVQGTLSSSPSDQFTIEFFVSPSCDPSGFGEGTTFIGSATTTTDASGHAAFSMTLPAGATPGARIAATATRTATGDTSEFSACLAVAQASAPVARASAMRTSGSAPFTVEFSSIGSSDPTGTITSYNWNFGDGFHSTEANPIHTYNIPGTYTATLTVTNNSNLSASDRVTIAVIATLRSTGVYLSALLLGTNVSVTGRVVVQTANGAAVQGAVVSSTWTKPGGETTADTAITDSTGTATFSFQGAPGTYTLTVTNATAAGYAFDPANSVLAGSVTQLGGGRRRSVRG